MSLEEMSLQCPWCGERYRTLVDGSAGGQSYIEDCAVCCSPIEIRFETDPDGTPWGLEARRA